MTYDEYVKHLRKTRYWSDALDIECAVSDVQGIADTDPASPLIALSVWDDWSGDYLLLDGAAELVGEWIDRYRDDKDYEVDRDAALDNLAEYVRAITERITTARSARYGQQLPLPM